MVEGPKGQYLFSLIQLFDADVQKKIEPDQLKDLLFTNSIETITNIESFNQDLTFYQLKQLYIIKGLTIDWDYYAKMENLIY